MTQPSLAIHYHRAAFTETASIVAKADRPSYSPAGLMGREVASAEFLSALLRYGRWSRLDALLAADEDRSSLTEVCHSHLHDSHQRRHLRIIPPSDQQAWIESPTAEVFHFPFPPDDDFARQRERTRRHALAICGVTHTLCSLAAMRTLWRYHSTHWQPYDRLICTSRAVESMVRETAAAMQADAHEAKNRRTNFHIGLEVCPLGIDLQKHRPPRPAERFDVRRRLGIPAENLVLLFTGRLSHHSKSQPYPMFAAAQYVAERNQQKVVLVLCGWFSHAEVRRGFERTARRVAPDVRFVVVDGMDPWWRANVWHAADVFISLADSIQETFGLTPLEATARGIPVVASDWNGYRDTIEHGQTGYLVPTTMISGSNLGLTSQLVGGEITYDQFLARVGQTVNVSITDACQSMLSLAKDPNLRQRFGSAGRVHAERRFGWPSIIAKYESIWETQRHELSCARKEQTTVSARVESLDVSNDPPHDLYYPPIEQSFRAYPAQWLEGEQVLHPSMGASQKIKDCLADPLCNHSIAWKQSVEPLRKLLISAPQSLDIQGWQQQLEGIGIPAQFHFDILGWLCKYGILVVKRSDDAMAADSQDSHAPASTTPLITFATTCKGRLDDLKHTLPTTLTQPDSTVVVTDYSCPQYAGKWVREAFPRVHVVSVPNRSDFNRSEAKNAAAFAANTDWICLLDADIVLDEKFVSYVKPLLAPRTVIRSDKMIEGTAGTFLCEREMFHRVGGHDPVYCGWGEEDEDLQDALKFVGCRPAFFPSNLLHHRQHDDSLRVQFHDEKTRGLSHTINRIYRCAKWDWSRIAGTVPPLDVRQRLHHQISEQVKQIQMTGSSSRVEIDLGSLAWNPLNLQCKRVLQYQLGIL